MISIYKGPFTQLEAEGDIALNMLKRFIQANW